MVALTSCCSVPQPLFVTHVLTDGRHIAVLSRVIPGDACFAGDLLSILGLHKDHRPAAFHHRVDIAGAPEKGPSASIRAADVLWLGNARVAVLFGEGSSGQESPPLLMLTRMQTSKTSERQD